jgi:hypothetical protein
MSNTSDHRTKLAGPLGRLCWLGLVLTSASCTAETEQPLTATGGTTASGGTVSTTGGNPGTGGDASGGTSSSTGGSTSTGTGGQASGGRPSGGANSGGTATGGMGTGGSASGGKATGGMGTGGSASGGKATGGMGTGGSASGGKATGGTATGGRATGGTATGGTGTGGSSSSTCSTTGGGKCPTSLTCPTGASGTITCGCYTVSGLGATKKALLDAGASQMPYFLASAMLETETMLTSSYAVGDGKTGDSFNAGVCKQNWGMIRTCHPAWNGLGASSYQTCTAMNGDNATSRALDVQVYIECRNHYGNNWWAGHRNGSAGLSNPNTADIQNFKAGMDWTWTQIQNGHLCDDVRFWVNLPAIIIE